MTLDSFFSDEPLQRDILTDKVYDRVRRDLLTNEIAPGSRINIGALARRLQTSNTPLRHALARLESEGLVVSNAYRGFEAAPPLQSTTVEHLYEVRLLLEPPTASKAAVARSEDGLILLDAAFDSYALAARGAHEYSSALSQSDLEFHKAVAEASGNSQVSPILSRVMIAMRVFDGKVEPGAIDRTIEEHDAIRRAVGAGDGVAAAAAMERHLDASRGRWRASRDH